jgi:hypothetical protein
MNISLKTLHSSGVYSSVFLGRIYPYDIEIKLAQYDRDRYRRFNFYVSDTMKKYLTESRKHLNIYPSDFKPINNEIINPRIKR